MLTNLLVGQSPYQVVDAGALRAAAFLPGNKQHNLYDGHTPVALGQFGPDNLATDLIQESSTPTPVNTSFAVFDAAHGTIWIPVSYVPDWTLAPRCIGEAPALQNAG